MKLLWLTVHPCRLSVRSSADFMDTYWASSTYYETINRKLNRRLIYECRRDERLKAISEGSTLLAYTELRGGLEHLSRYVDDEPSPSYTHPRICSRLTHMHTHRDTHNHEYVGA
jgi:hypothetical protein